MTVCTHEVAFGDFLEQPPPTPRPLDQGTDVGDFDLAWAMIPLHRCRVENSAAVGAGSVALEASIELDDLAPIAPLLLESKRTVRRWYAAS